MTLWSQGCSELLKLLHGCDEVVARLLQGCDKVAGTLQPCHFCMGSLNYSKIPCQGFLNIYLRL